MPFNKTESARFAQENQKIVGELHAGVDKALAEAASRGFTAPPGDTLATILFAGQAAKDKLVEANGKIYDDRRKVLFEQDEFAMKMIVSLAKLGMQLYAAELIFALELESAEKDALRDQGNADVIRMNAEVDKRQVAIIQARAEMEHRITVLKEALVNVETVTLISERALITAQLGTTEKKLEVINSIYKVIASEKTTLGSERDLITEQLVTAVKRLEVIDSTYRIIDAENTTLTSERALIVAQIATAREKLAVINSIYGLLAAERSTMTSERALIDAQVATAEKKLEIIDSIYQVLAAEELVLAAENRRAETLTVLLAAENVVAEVKRAMTPFYIEKAEARLELADAIMAEIPVQKAIVELGYDRIILKNTEEAAAHQIREAEEEYELARAAWVRAQRITEFARTQSGRLVKEYANAIQAEILAAKKTLEMNGVDYSLDTSFDHKAIEIKNSLEITTKEWLNLTLEITSILAGLSARAASETGKVAASAFTYSETVRDETSTTEKTIY